MSASASSVGGKETQLQTEEAWSPQICTNTHTEHQCKGSRACGEHEDRFLGGIHRFKEATAWQQTRSDGAGHALMVKGGLAFNLSLSLCLLFLTQVSQQISEGEPLHCWNHLQASLQLTLVCVYAPAETGEARTLCRVNPISLNAPSHFYHCSFCHATSDAKQRQKFGPGTFSTFQS